MLFRWPTYFGIMYYSCTYLIEPNWSCSRKLWRLIIGLCAKGFSGDEVSHKCFHWVIQGQSQAPTADDRQHAVDICLLFSFRAVVKITDTVSLSLLPSLLSCTVQRNWILSLKLSTSGWSFSEAQTACVITDRSIPCGILSQLTLLAQEMMRSMQLWHWQAPERRQLHLLEKCSPLAWLGGSALSLLC